MRDHDELIVQVEPERLDIVPELLQPTAQDQMAVQSDLTEYVSLVRRIEDAAPLVVLKQGGLVVLDGAPFVKAAQSAVPSLPSIYCRFRGNRAELPLIQLREASLESLQIEFDELQVREFAEMMFFRDPVPDQERLACHAKVQEFFNSAVNRPQEYGGEYSWISPFEWKTGGTALLWRWRRSNGPGRHFPRLLRTLAAISSEVAPIRSWNGLARIPDDPRKLLLPDEIPQ